MTAKCANDKITDRYMVKPIRSRSVCWNSSLCGEANAVFSAGFIENYENHRRRELIKALGARTKMKGCEANGAYP